MKKAILCTSFGTSIDAARESITAVEKALCATAPDRIFARAYTSSIIRRILEKRGQPVMGVAQALESLAAEGAEDVFVQPTHILCGSEYEKIKREMTPWQDRFRLLRVGRPLVSGTEDLRHLAEIVAENTPMREGEALVLFGHGSDHFADMVYPALQTAFHLAGRKDVLVGTVEGWPTFEDVVAQLRDSGCTDVHLLPLMLVAGDHVLNDMAGEDPESWKSQLETLGYSVRCTLRGLGMMPGIAELYCRHLREDLAIQE